MTTVTTRSGKGSSLTHDDVDTNWNNLNSDKAEAPSSSTDNAVARYDGTSGDIQDSGVTVDDSDNLDVPGTLTVDGASTLTGNVAVGGTVDGRDVATDGTKLDGIESSATADQTDAEIETAYNNQVSVVGQSEAEAGTATTVRRWTAQRVFQAIAALGSDVSASASNLVVTRPTVSTVRIRCMDAILRDVNGDTFRTGPVDVTVDITASGANGLDQGAESNVNYALFLIYNGTAVAGIMALTELSGTADGTTANKLVNSGDTFQTDNVQVGAWVTNTTDNTRTRVSAVDSETQLSLEDDIFESGESYKISNEKPELPTGYTFWTPPISAVSNVSGDLLDFSQSGNLYHFTARRSVATNLSSTSYATQSVASQVFAHTGRVQDVLFGGTTDNGAGDAKVFLSDDGTNAKTIFVADSASNGVGSENELYSIASASPVFVPIDNDVIHYKVDASDVDLYVRAFHLDIPVT